MGLDLFDSLDNDDDLQDKLVPGEGLSKIVSSTLAEHRTSLLLVGLGSQKKKKSFVLDLLKTGLF